jgi:carbonic anhydrase
MAAGPEHWSYEGEAGPDHWSELDHANATCSAGSQESPIDIKNSISAALPPIQIAWNRGGRMINNGHTIQINVPPGSKLTRGGSIYELVQYHFHHPSEHLLNAKSFAMEAHFVHKDVASDALGVLGVFLVKGQPNQAFAQLAAAFPVDEGAEVAVDEIDPHGLLPDRLGYWFYEGSLTTPPCTENVDWMMTALPLQVAASDIQRFSALYANNARPVMPGNRRFVLRSR